MMILYKISLPAVTGTEEFTKFMRDRYFPAIHKEATRVGQVIRLVLLESDSEKVTENQIHEFYWLVGWEGLCVRNIRVDNEEVTRQFEWYKAELQWIGCFKEVARWPEKERP